MSFVRGYIEGAVAFFRSEKEAHVASYDAGFSDGTDGREPLTQEVNYQDGYLDGYEHGRYLPPLA